jgi:phage terminase large subunit
MNERNRLLQKISETVVDPVRFVREVLRENPWSVQEEILRSVAKNSQTAVKASNASGKTRTAAEAVLWWLVRYSDGIAITTAPTYEQVQKLLWREIHQAIGRSRDFEFPEANLVELKLGPGNYGAGLSTNKGVNFQGFHSPHLLIVVDEAPGVDSEIWEAIEGARAGGDVHLLILGNPTTISGFFYDAFTKERHLWNTFSIDAFDTPNLAGFTLEDLRKLPRDLPESAPVFQYKPFPALVTRRWVYEKFLTWGEESPLWQARVRGEFPTNLEDALIPLSWLEAASKRATSGTGGSLYAGIDVAGPGKDETSVVVRSESGTIVAQSAWVKPDPRGEVVHFLAPFKARLHSVNVDRVGLGEYFAHHLRDLGYRIEFVNVATAARRPDSFSNLKAELYWSLRERFEKGEIAGLTDELTIQQLASIRFEYNSRGLVVIESKEDARKRGVSSPDRAEALMLAFSDVRPYGIAFFENQLAYRRQCEVAIAQGRKPPDRPKSPLEKRYEEQREKYKQQRSEEHCADCDEPLGRERIEAGGLAYCQKCVDKRNYGQAIAPE